MTKTSEGCEWGAWRRGEEVQVRRKNIQVLHSPPFPGEV
jgi:hypothetical protein